MVGAAPSVYLAGPEVFLPNGAEIGRRKQHICTRHGLNGLFPLDNKVEVRGSLRRAAAEIFAGDVAMMRRAGAIIANLTAFRGPSADVGTVFELGFMAALGKPLFAYTTTAGTYAERVARLVAVSRDDKDRLIDPDGILVENFKGEDNLMITESLANFGLRLLVVDRGAKGDIGDLEAFERCAEIAAAHLRAQAR